MSIDWKPIQRRLGVTPDGIPGRATYGRLFALMGPSAQPAIIASLANSAAVHFAEYGALDSPQRLADLLAQTANETGGFTRFEEDLRYRAATMLSQWPGHFTEASANAAVGKPYEIAEIAYGVKSKKGVGRMGNTRPGDGYMYRGRGMLQLTGRGNYEATDRRLGIGLDTNPDLAAVPALSLMIALDFYRENKVWAAIDAGDTTKARKITNGGSIGLDHVNALRKKILGVLT